MGKKQKVEMFAKIFSPNQTNEDIRKTGNLRTPVTPKDVTEDIM